MNDIVGWDIGGVNTKVARVERGTVVAVSSRAFELQRAPEALEPLLRELAIEVGATRAAAHAITMTAELSQMFRTKREGVAFVLSAVESAFPGALLYAYTVDGRFVATDEGRREPLAVAAANWSATARMVARHHPDAVLVDIGTTTTDVIPIVGGRVVASGRTDPERLASGELVYTGALRTPAEAMASHVPLRGRAAGVSAEGFALAGDVHVWRGDLAPADYTVATPDGRPVTRQFCGERLARVVCADRDLLDEAAVSWIADALAAAQIDRIAEAVRRVASAHRSVRAAVVTGLGAFLGHAAVGKAGLAVVPLATELGEAAARCAPAAAVALLLTRDGPAEAGHYRNGGDDADHRNGGDDADHRNGGDDAGDARARTPSIAESFRGAARPEPPRVDAVVKLGGGVLAHLDEFATALAMIAAAAGDRRLVVVPGGGPFADLVREVDRRQHLRDSTAHWMAILAMDQYAELIAERLPGAALVTDGPAIGAALDAGRIPVLAPSRWLREADPLPHSWDVTSDSIAAWMAGALGARRVVLIKPAAAIGAALVDAHFARALPPGVRWNVLTAGRIDSSVGMTFDAD